MPENPEERKGWEVDEYETTITFTLVQRDLKHPSVGGHPSWVTYDEIGPRYLTEGITLFFTRREALQHLIDCISREMLSMGARRQDLIDELAAILDEEMENGQAPS